MRRSFLALAAGLVLLGAPGARAGQSDALRATYERFVTAQNARDLPAVRDVLLDSPTFLWVSDGKTFWGRETMLARMASYQRAEVWSAQPDLGQAVIVEVSPTVGYIHMPLTLRLGSLADGVSDTHFLVSILFRHTEDGWRIAALFTTIRNTG